MGSGELPSDGPRNEAAGVGAYETHALLQGGDVQAVMMLETKAHSSRAGSGSVVYVEYLAVAPWNRQGMGNAPRFMGCGSGIILAAMERSRELGYDGRLGLHSLPGAMGFYQKLGLKDWGPDPSEQGLHYFEGTFAS